MHQTGDCLCNYIVDSNGYGLCKKQYAALSNRRVCYVTEPSTCPDLVTMSSGSKLSAEACLQMESK